MPLPLNVMTWRFRSPAHLQRRLDQSQRARGGRRAAVVAICGVVLTGCSDESGSAEAASLFSEARQHRLQVGMDEQSPPESTLGYVLAARLTENGNHLIVLDFVEPYIKVFNRSGRFERAFLREGGGPGEARRPSVLGVAGDSLILVSDGTGRMSVFDLEGALQAEASHEAFFALAAVAGCDGQWTIYGPRFERQSKRATWLHRIRFNPDGSASANHVMRDSMAAPMLPQGVAYGLTERSDTLYLWHTLGARRLLVGWSCDELTPRVLYDEDAGHRPRITEASKGTVKLEVGPGSRAKGGMVAVAGGVVIGEIVRERDGASTELTFVSLSGDRKTVKVPGSYVLRDSREGVGVLVSSSEPAPRVFLIGEDELKRLFPGH
jgi:hypothetical protein